MNPMTSSSLGPLNIGNVVSAAFSLYKSRFKTYLKIAAIAILWAFVPVYGWAKCAMNLALIARLAFGEITDQPETVVEARRKIQDKLWNFFGAGLLVNFLQGAICVAVLLVCVILVAIVAVAVGAAAGQTAGIVAAVMLGIVAFVVYLAAALWIVARFLVTSMPIAVEEDVEIGEAIGRSWKLTQASALRIMTITFVAGLITLPLSLIGNFPRILIQVTPEDSPLLALWVLLFIVMLGITNIIVTPFWQVIKALIYYDLRSRKEGLDIQLRDRPL